MDARAEILGNIKKALQVAGTPPPKPDLDAEIYIRPEVDTLTEFIANFVARKGTVYYCENEDLLRLDLQTLIASRNNPITCVWEPALLELLGTDNFNFRTDDKDFAKVEIGITLCECMIARTGSFLVTSKQLAGRRLTIYPPTHIVVATTSQLLSDIGDGLEFLKKKYGEKLPSMISLVTGASRTADIEKTLVLGAHGPRELILFLVDDLHA